MSLLLQALQKAAKNREGSGPEQEPVADLVSMQTEALEPAPESGRGAEPAHSEFTLAEEEEMFEAVEPIRAIEPPPPIAPARNRTSSLSSAPSSAQAATVLRASEARSTGALDWVRDRPEHALAIAGAIFGVFYGAYVYLQIFHPAVLRGDFLKQPLQAKAPPAAPKPIAPPPAPAIPTAEPSGSPSVATQGATPPSPTVAAPAQKPLAGMPSVKAPSKSSVMSEQPPPVARPLAREATMRRRLTAVDVQGSAAMEDTVSVKPPETRSAFVAPSLMQAWDALQQGRLDQAESLYQTVIQTDPQNVDALLGLATIANRRGSNDQAVRQYERVLELDPRNAAAQAGLISIIGQADPQLSESRLKELISREPSGFLYFALGNVYAKQGQWAQAQQAYFQAYQLQPDNADYAYNLAVGLEHIGQTKIALTYYRKAVDLSSGKGHASFDASRVQERIGQLSARIGND